MATHQEHSAEIDRIVGEVSEQTNLLAQIQSALEGKAAGGGGASVGTCEVTVVHTTGTGKKKVGYTTLEDGVVVGKVADLSGLSTSVKVEALAGSCVSVFPTYIDSVSPGMSTCATNGTVLHAVTEDAILMEPVGYIIALPSSGNCTITFS